MNVRDFAATLLLLSGTALSSSAWAQAEGQEATDNSFALGQIVVTGVRPEGVGIGSETIQQNAMELFNRARLDDAVSLVPGVVAGNSGGSRNERLIFVRGFDRFQVPLSIDGIRVYLPADNRLDFGRFLTPDVAEVQIAKSYASVLDGPGAMGGAINLVTRKPTREIEGEVRGTLNLDRDFDYGGYTVFGLLGTRQEKWYAQASFARNFTHHWTLPDSFIAVEPTLEDGGKRDFSRTEDWRINAKVGFTPNATDEYVLSYTRQEGAKNAPLHVSDTVSSARYWSWPQWNIDSIYFLSSTALGDQATLKTRVYYNEFYNMLRAFDDATQTTQLKTRMPASFDSPYSDNAYGGSAQLDVAVTEQDTLSLAFHYRRDQHDERQIAAPDLAGSVYEPNQQSAERTWSIAAENRLDLSPALKLTLGISYDWRDLDRAEEYNSTTGMFTFPLRNADGLNGQGRLDWSGDDGSQAHISLSSRVRFPTLFERFSSQFGTAVPNPELRPERATNAEIGGSKRFGPLNVSGALFYSWLNDALVSVRLPGNLNQRTNIGSADYYGAEISADVDISPTLQIGGNYSYIHRDFDVGTAPTGGFIRLFQLTDVPNHKGFAYVTWKPVPALSLTPNVEWAGKRMTVTPATANADTPVYYKTGSHVLANLTVDFALTEQFSLSAGVRNAFDELYTLTDGFPEPGRSVFVTARARF